jgi:hypothetical protein
LCLGAALLLGSGCNALLGLGEFREGAGGSTGAGGTGTTAAATASSSSTGVAPTCTDAEANGQETDLDCGGPCPTCADGKKCNVPQDCMSGTCVEKLCVDPACDDGVKDGKEPDIDCGGTCLKKCDDGKGCATAADCKNGICNGAFTCEASTCTDGVANGNESGVDCGGACTKCAIGQACKGAGDCQSGLCGSKLCVSNLTWVKSFGDAEFQLVSGMAQNLQGSVFLTGTLNGSADFGGGVLTSAGQGDVFIAELNSSGNYVYAKRFGDDQYQSASAITVGTFDTVAITGAVLGDPDFGGGPLSDPLSVVGSDAFLAYYDKSGNHVQSQRFNANYAQYGTAMSRNDFGGFAWGGDLGDSLDFGCGGALTSAGNTDVFVVGSTNGTCWSKRYGDVNQQNLLSMSYDNFNNLWVSGKFQGSIDFGGGPFTMTTMTTPGAFAAKLDPAGATLWATSFGNNVAYQEAQSIVADPSSTGAVVGGSFYGTLDFGGGISVTSHGNGDIFVAKLGGTGAPIWAKAFGDASNQVGHVVLSVDLLGDIIVAGDFEGTLDFGGGPMVSAGQDDLFVVKLDPSGNFVWGQRFGDAASQRIAAVSAFATDEIFVTGTFQGTVDFGGTSVTSNGSYDIFVAKLLVP